MTRYQYVVLTEAVAGREREFESWYDKQHLADVVRVPGVVSATRHRIEKLTSPVDGPRWISLAIYEIESDAPDEVLAEIGRRANTDQMPLTDALVASTTLQILARPAIP